MNRMTNLLLVGTLGSLAGSSSACTSGGETLARTHVRAIGEEQGAHRQILAMLTGFHRAWAC